MKKPDTYWNVPEIERLMRRRGATKPNGNQLSELTGLTIPTAYGVLSGAALEKIQTSTLRTLVRELKPRAWHQLVRFEPDDPR